MANLAPNGYTAGFAKTIRTVSAANSKELDGAPNEGLVWFSSRVAATSTPPLLINEQIIPYTLVLTDKDKLVEMNSGSSNTLTIPTNAAVEYPVGTEIKVVQTGSGQTTIAGASGVTVNGTPGLKLRAQWSVATLIKRASNTWLVRGDLSA